MSDDYRYHVTYALEPHPEGLTKAEVPKDRGACNAVVLTSILLPPDGSLSIAFASLDGRSGEEISDDELFKVWCMLAHRLSESETLGDGRKQLVTAVWKTVRDAVARVRAGGPS